MMNWRLWMCLYLPWHKLIHSFWASEQCEVCHCSHCDREWVLNHEIEAVLPWDDEFKRFYRERNMS